MSPGGTDASLPELLVGFFVAASLIAVLTTVLRRRRGHQDLLGTQLREMEARAAAAASPDADTRLRDAATRIADARMHETASALGPTTPDPAPAEATSSAVTSGAVTSSAVSSGTATSSAVSSGAMTSDAVTSGAATSSAVTSGAVTSGAVTSGAVTSAGAAHAASADATSAGAGFSDVTAGARPAQDATAPPDGWPSAAGGTNDAMADAYAWLRIAALVEAGQREQAIELLSTTMTISAEDAELLADGLTDPGGERHPD